MIPRPPASLWWFFFPITGMQLESQSDALTRPLFGDATVLCADDLTTILAPDHNDSAFVPAGTAASDQSLHDDAPARSSRWPSYTTYIGVCRTTALNTQWLGDDRDSQQMIQAARQRALDITSFLTLVLMTQAANGHSCALADDEMERSTHFALWHPDDQHFVVSYGTAMMSETLIGNDEYALVSIDDLRASCVSPLLSGLYEAICVKKTALAKTLRTSMVQAMVRFQETLVTPSYGGQLLGAYTCLEILLTPTAGASTTKQLQNRLKWLIGSSLYAEDRYSAEQVFKARHDYVHRGTSLSTRRQTLWAFGLAVAALVRYGMLAQHVQHKDALLAYLDLYTLQQQSVKDAWMEQSLTASPIYTILAAPLMVPFLEWIDATLEVDQEFDDGFWDREDRIYTPKEAPNTPDPAR